MHQQIITSEQFAVIDAALEVFARAEKAGRMTIVGKHAELGVCVLTTSGADGSSLLSQVPYEAVERKAA